MKQITLKFREVAIDGLPEVNTECAVVHDNNMGFPVYPNRLPYCKSHGTFNTRDEYDAERANSLAIDNITYWMPLDEFNAAFKEEIHNAD